MIGRWGWGEVKKRGGEGGGGGGGAEIMKGYKTAAEKCIRYPRSSHWSKVITSVPASSVNRS